MQVIQHWSKFAGPEPCSVALGASMAIHVRVDSSSEAFPPAEITVAIGWWFDIGGAAFHLLNYPPALSMQPCVRSLARPMTAFGTGISSQQVFRDA
jgi:hypothetical protein